MRLPQYPKLPIPTLKSQRNSTIVIGIFWIALAAWRLTSEPNPWIGILMLVISVLMLVDPVLRQLEINSRKRTYPQPEAVE
jgi:hypothetical protein